MIARLLLLFAILGSGNASGNDEAVPPLTLFALPKVDVVSASSV